MTDARDLFACSTCGQLLVLDNDACLSCGAELGLRPSTGTLDVLDDDDLRCSLHDLIGCTWLVEDPDEAPEGRCRSCRLTTATPPHGDVELVAQWAETERAKRRLVHEGLALGLPVETVEFRLLASDLEPVVIGHEDGVITIDVAETDDAHRVAMREQLDEPYRTMLGHLRHEMGHALFAALVLDAGHADAFRELFGDERADYQEAVDRHYAEGPPAGWQDEHVSAYATMHPHEDWAETFAHYLHIRSALRTARQAGIVPEQLLRRWRRSDPERFDAPADPAEVTSGASVLLDRWLPLAMALNAVNRAVGHEDLYPFVLSATVVSKLSFVHDAVTAP